MSEPNEMQGLPSVERCMAVAAEACGMDVDAIRFGNRCRDNVMARDLCVYLLRSRRKMSWPEIAMALNMKSHGTAIAAHRRALSSAELMRMVGVEMDLFGSDSAAPP